MAEELRAVARYAIVWALVFLGVLAGFVSIPGGLFLVLAGVVAHPYLWGTIEDRFEIEVPRWGVVAAVAVPVLVGVVVLVVTVTGVPFGGAAPDDGDLGNTTNLSTPAVETMEQELGESFVVGSGGDRVSVTISNVSRYDHVSTEFTSAIPDGVFLVVTVELDNQGDSVVQLSPEAVRLVDAAGDTYMVDAEAAGLTADDERIGERGFSGGRLQPGLSATRVAVFDVPRAGEYALLIEDGSFYGNEERHRIALDG